MYDISLYGHLTFDRIFNGFIKDTSVGSIGNVWKSLNKVNPDLKINIEPTAIGEALIMINEDKSERTSIANLNMKTKEPTILESKWNHILYINELKDLSFVEKIKNGIISADICRGNILSDLNILKKIDFLFISDEDLFMDIDQLYPYVKNAVILHHKGGSICYLKDGSKIETDVKVLDNINVLGCGDMLASYFINEFLDKGDIEKSIKIAHKLVTKNLEK
jgi:sugar/nucleoside kinase (ribokinase family)